MIKLDGSETSGQIDKILKSASCVQINHVTKRFGEDMVLKDINLTLNYGQVYGIVGNNGSGKYLAIIADPGTV